MAKESVANLTAKEIAKVITEIEAGTYSGIRRYDGVDYVGMRETTYMVKLHYSTVRNYTVRGLFPAKKFGRQYLIDWKKTLKLINSGELADITANSPAR